MRDCFLEKTIFLFMLGYPLPVLAEQDAEIARGKELYHGTTCVACHGKDGKGGLMGVPDFTAKDGPLSKSDETLIKNIIDGFQSADSPMAMPPLGGSANLSKEDVESIVKYIRKTFGPNVS